MAGASAVKREQIIIPRIKPEDDLLVLNSKPTQYDYPHSPATNMAIRALGAQGDLYEMAARMNRHPTAHGRQMGYKKQNGMITLVYKSGSNKYILQIPDLDALSKYNKGTKKIFNFILIKLNQQAYSDHVFRRNYISFPLSELLEIGMYSDKKSARRGFLSAMSIWTRILCGGEIGINGNKTVSQSEIEIPFTGAKVIDGECYVYLNERMNWGYIATFYTILPAFYFSLPTKAADLCQYIFERARQCYDDIKEKGYFTIKNRSIAQFLGLPDESEAKNPYRDIKQRIEEAITDIEEKVESSGERGSLKLTPQGKDRVSITEYLDNGYLRVEIAGSYKEKFLELAESKEKGIAKARKKKEKIVEAAKIKRLADKMKESEKKK